jgi:hypothetical protein
MSVLLIGCDQSPSINVLGAFFPEWMFCIIGALLSTVLVHYAIKAARRAEHIGRWTWTLVYPSLCTLFALLGWLLFFKN